MQPDYRNISNETISNANTAKNQLVEKILTLRCAAYLSQIKAQLLTNTIYEIDGRNKVLFNTNHQLEREIYERKLAEKKLENAKKKAEEATLLKDKFVALVSHDLKNPLNQIMGYLQLAQMTNDPPEEIADIFKEILLICADMNNLINDILSLDRIKDGKLEPQYVAINIEGMIASVLNVYEGKAREKGIKLINNVSLNTFINADKKLLTQVINNLVSNAIKFCRKGDSITISISLKEPTTIIVADTGVGISPNIINDIFHYEKKTSTPGTLGEPGTGFGLPLAYHIINAHRGKLQVKSNLGEGTTFYIKLPNVKNQRLTIKD